jgi:hypothetical protein
VPGGAGGAEEDDFYGHDTPVFQAFSLRYGCNIYGMVHVVREDSDVQRAHGLLLA